MGPLSIDLNSLAYLRIEAEITDLMNSAGIPQLNGPLAEAVEAPLTQPPPDSAPNSVPLAQALTPAPPAQAPLAQAALAQIVHRLKAGLKCPKENAQVAALDIVETLLRQVREKLGDSDFAFVMRELTDELVGLANEGHQDARRASIELVATYLPHQLAHLLEDIRGELGAERPDVRRFAVEAVRLFGLDLASTVIDEVVKLVDDDPAVAMEALATLGWIGTAADRAVPKIVSGTKWEDPIASSAAGRALMAIDPGGKRLPSVLDNEQRANVLRTLGEIGPEARQLRLVVESHDALQMPLTRKEVARLLNMHPRTLDRHVESGGIKLRIQGDRYLLSPAEIERFKAVKGTRKRRRSS